MIHERSPSDQWPLASFGNHTYHLRVYGPDVFFREFKGTADDPRLTIECEYQPAHLIRNKLTGDIALKIANPNQHQTIAVVIKDNAYRNKPMSRKVAAGSEVTIVLSLSGSFSWYDFSISINGNPDILKRYAGRVETGKEGFSDPFMGRTIT
ncbi:MAG: phospholipase domain-containing protein [Ferruginibacter sp.]